MVSETNWPIRRPILIWADTNVASDSSDTKQYIDKIHEIVEEVELAPTLTQCIKLLEQVEPTRCYLIISSSFGKDLVPQIHSIPHLESIFLFCRNKSSHDQWAREWSKVRGVYTDIQYICDELKSILKQLTNEEIVMSIILDDDDDYLDARKLPPSFMYTSILKDTFLDIRFGRRHKLQMIRNLLNRYEGRNQDIKMINELARDHLPEKAIWWYTRSCFIYQDVNRGLRELNADFLVDMAYFIVDLHKQIKRIFDEQLPKLARKITVYRGQGMTDTELVKLRQSTGDLLSFNCFLSTNKSADAALKFAESGAGRQGYVGVLFVITVDSSLRTVPFADIKEHSFYPNEGEILFSMHTIFKIGRVEKHPSRTNTYRVQLDLTDEKDVKLIELQEYMVEQYGTNPEHRIGQTLIDIGDFDKAEEIYVLLLDAAIDETDKGSWNHQLGVIKDRQGKYQLALEYYQKALGIHQRILSEYHSKTATTYDCIGSVYKNMGENSKALANHEKSLGIRKKVLSEDHPDIATSFNNIGFVFQNMGDHSTALTNYEKSLNIRKKVLPKYHPDIGKSCYHIGVLLYHMDKRAQALQYLEKARNVYMRSLLTTDPCLQNVNNWIEKARIHEILSTTD